MPSSLLQELPGVPVQVCPELKEKGGGDNRREKEERRGEEEIDVSIGVGAGGEQGGWGGVPSCHKRRNEARRRKTE